MLRRKRLKQWLAFLVRLPLVSTLMQGMIRLVVPRHRIGVTLILFNEMGHVLLLRHVFHPELPWGPPGGWLGYGEDPQAGALRELQEETGLTAVIHSIIYTSREPGPDHIGLAYVAHTHSNQPLKLSTEILEAKWFDPSELPPVYPFTQQAILIAVTNGHSVPT